MQHYDVRCDSHVTSELVSIPWRQGLDLCGGRHFRLFTGGPFGMRPCLSDGPEYTSKFRADPWL